MSERAECQVCEAEQATKSDGSLYKHGYERPGWGFIVGACPGSDHQPFPAHDKLEEIIDRAEAHVSQQLQLAEDLPKVRVETHRERTKRGREIRYSWVETAAEFNELVASLFEAGGNKRRSARGRWHDDTERFIPSEDNIWGWEAHCSWQRKRHEDEAEQTQVWLKRARERLAEARELTESSAA